MAEIHIITGNPFFENTYIVFDETKQCVIIDPGLSNAQEQNALTDFIKNNTLNPVMLLNTHCHIDHVLGNKFVFDNYGLKPRIHKEESIVLELVPVSASKYGFYYEPSPLPEIFLEENDIIEFGDTRLKVLFAPGHAPGHVCFYNEKDNFLIGGDVLFQGSIGRTDLPYGDYNQLINSINTRLMPLPDDCVVYPGHGGSTSIGRERKYNPFLNDMA